LILYLSPPLADARWVYTQRRLAAARNTAGNMDIRLQTVPNRFQATQVRHHFTAKSEYTLITGYE
jgi:hypothetical protein